MEIDSRSMVPMVTAGATKAPAIAWSSVFRAVAIAAFLIAALRAVVFYASIPNPAQSVGVDFRLYTDAARMWLATGQFYPAWETAGPYLAHGAGEILYPPIALWLLVPFTALPAVLWSAIPPGLTIWAIARMRPAWWALALIGALSVTHSVQAPFFWGQPIIWLLPVVAWGLLEGWPIVFVLVKPTLAPYLLAGMGKPRRLVIGGVVFALLALPFGAMWLDWLAAVRNGNLGLLYGLDQNLIFGLPVIAWLGRWTRT